MAQTPILAIPQIAEGQSSAYLVANAGITALEEAENRQLAVDMSGGDVTLTETQFLRNVLFRCSGQVDDDNLTIPDEITVDGSPVTPQRKFLVRNDSDTYSVTVTDGTLTFEIPTESTALLIYDGTNLDGIVAADDASALTALTDTPANYTGSGGFFIRVKDDESGVEFVTIKAQELGVDVTDSANYTTLNFDDTVFGASASGGVLTIDFDPAQISVTDLADMPAAPGASEDGMALIWDNDADAFVFGEAGGGGESPPASLTENEQTGTSYTLVLTDGDGKIVSFTNASAVTLTLPTNAAVEIPVGRTITLWQKGDGQVSVEGDTGVTLSNPSGASDKLRAKDSWATVIKTGTDEWSLIGDLETTPGTLADAEDVAYDNTTSGLTAADLQAAIDEIVDSTCATEPYEEGSFTPTIAFATNGDLSFTYSHQTGSYTRIGNRVFGDLDVGATGGLTHTTASGMLEIGGLPFACGTLAGNNVARETMGEISWSGRTELMFIPLPGETYGGLRASGEGVTGFFLSEAQVASGDALRTLISISYSL